MKMIRLFESASHSHAYAQFRPKTPEDVVTKAIDYMKNTGKTSLSHSGKHDLMIDVGCGGGQSTSVFAPYFKKIIGIDPSENQIKQAVNNNKHSQIIYEVGQGEDLSKYKNVDLIACGQSLHWMDFHSFFGECNKVLKPDGCLLLHGYDRPRLCPASSNFDSKLAESAEELFSTFYSKCLFHARRKHIEDRYSTIFEMLKSSDKMRDDTLTNSIDCSLFDFYSYLKTWSGYIAYLRNLKESNPNDSENGTGDILHDFMIGLKKEWNHDDDLKIVPVKVVFSLFLILTKQPDI